jgi:uncharacterized protein YdiU (UPF0061 family)
MGDGRAVLRSVIREYLAGHALNALVLLQAMQSVSPLQRRVYNVKL